MREVPGGYRPVRLISVPGKNMEIVLGAIEGHLKNNVIIRSSQPGFIKTKFFKINLISFYDEIVQVVDEGEAVDVVNHNCLQMPDFKVKHYKLEYQDINLK